jgi:hypothetical protein
MNRERTRTAILVRMLDGEIGVQQRAAIEQLARPGESLSAAMRRVLLAAADRSDLDHEAVHVAERAAQGGRARALSLLDAANVLRHHGEDAGANLAMTLALRAAETDE